MEISALLKNQANERDSQWLLDLEARKKELKEECQAITARQNAIKKAFTLVDNVQNCEKELAKFKGCYEREQGKYRGFPPCCTEYFQEQLRIGKAHSQHYQDNMLLACDATGALLNKPSYKRMGIIRCLSCAAAITSGDVSAIVYGWNWPMRIAVSSAKVDLGLPIIGIDSVDEVLEVQSTVAEMMATDSDSVWSAATTNAAVRLLKVAANYAEGGSITKAITGLNGYVMPTELMHCAVWGIVGPKILLFASSIDASKHGAKQVASAARCFEYTEARCQWQQPKRVHTLSSTDRCAGLKTQKRQRLADRSARSSGGAASATLPHTATGCCLPSST
jgi:hypothetical protein